MGNYKKNLSDRHPQVKVKTFSNNEKKLKKVFGKLLLKAQVLLTLLKKVGRKKLNYSKGGDYEVLERFKQKR